MFLYIPSSEEGASLALISQKAYGVGGMYQATNAETDLSQRRC